MIPRRRREEDLSVPRTSQLRLGLYYDPEMFGRFSETVARYLGTAKFLVGQTALVLVWIAFNSWGLTHHWDPYPFILLNLAFSTQAAYAAPLILLAQNRQDERDRATVEIDREVAARTQADAEFLARELSSLRIALADVVTTDDLGAALERLERRLDGLTDQWADPSKAAPPKLNTPPSTDTSQ